MADQDGGVGALAPEGPSRLCRWRGLTGTGNKAGRQKAGKASFRRLAPIVGPYRHKLAFAVGMAVAGQMIVALTPLVQKIILDDAILSHRQPLTPWIRHPDGTGVVAFAGNYLRRRVGGRLAIDVQRQLQLAVHHHLQHLDGVRGELPVLLHHPRQHRRRTARRQRLRRDPGGQDHAHDFIVALHEGYNTPVGERGFTLSGGERQRIAPAPAALANHKILVLDDATRPSTPAPRRPSTIRWRR